LWVLLWVVVLFLAMGVLALFGLSLYRKAKALIIEVSTAADRLGAVSAGLQELADAQNDPAVFTPAAQVRREQILNKRRPGGKHSSAQAGQKQQSGVRSARSQGQRVR
jgi:hypothetical protein